MAEVEEPPVSSPPTPLPYVPFPSFESWAANLVMPQSFERYSRAFADLRTRTSQGELEQLIRVASRWAAFDTGAIEGLYEAERGFTFTVAASAAAWDNIHLLKGTKVQRAAEDALRAYDLVLDIASKRETLTEAAIRTIHEVICDSQETYTVVNDLGLQEHELVKGAYKTEFNNPLNIDKNEVHGYAPPLDTAPEMARLVEELRSVEFQNASPLLQAAYAHYAFVCIHPFPDGNGRVSRALASIYLYREPGLPLVVFADQKPGYIAALESADGGDYMPFVQFVSDRVVDTVGMVQAAVSSSGQPSIREQIQNAQAMLTGRGGMSHQDIDAIGARLLESFEVAIAKVITESELSSPLSAAVDRRQGAVDSPPAGYRIIPGGPFRTRLLVQSEAPATAAVARTYGVAVAKPDFNGPDFVIYHRDAVVVDVLLREVHPIVATALQFREQAVIETELGLLLETTVAMAQEQLKAQGYA
jgi:Fic family protein